MPTSLLWVCIDCNPSTVPRANRRAKSKAVFDAHLSCGCVSTAIHLLKGEKETVYSLALCLPPPSLPSSFIWLPCPAHSTNASIFSLQRERERVHACLVTCTSFLGGGVNVHTSRISSLRLDLDQPSNPDMISMTLGAACRAALLSMNARRVRRASTSTAFRAYSWIRMDCDRPRQKSGSGEGWGGLRCVG